jgi:transglutaminase-like putative cysteine protease
MLRLVIIFISFISPIHSFAQATFRASDEDTFIFMERDLDTEEHWYGAYYTDVDGVDHKLGYMSLKYNEVLTVDGKRLFELDATSSLNFVSFGNNYEIWFNVKELYQAEPPFKLLKQQTNYRLPDLIESNFSYLREGKIHFIKFTNGEMSVSFEETIDIGLQDLYSADAWLEKRPIEIGESILVDELSEGKTATTKYTLTDVKNEIVGGVKYKFYELSGTSVGEEFSSKDLYFYKDENNWVKFAMDFGENFFVDFRLEPKQRALDLSVLADLYVLNSIFVEESSLNYVDFFGNEQTNQKNVWYEIIGNHDGLIEEDYPSQFVQKRADGRNFLVIGAGLNAFRDSDFEYEEVNEESFTDAKFFSENNPKLADLASELVENAKLHTNDWTDEEEIIRSIRSYVSDMIEDKYIYHEIADPYELLERPEGDCTEHTILFNALLKAAGIPARPASGYILADDSGRFSGHAWSEVAYEGVWIPVDATWDMWVENSINHIKTTNDVDLTTKDFRLRLHKIEYDSGDFEFFDGHYGR